MHSLITSRDARQRIDCGAAVLIDIRERNEHAREHIPGARLVPLSGIDAAAVARELGPGATPIYYCQSGNRTRMNAARLEACAPGDCLILDGGLNGWKSAGEHTALDRSQPIELQRQVQIVAGSLVLLGLLLGWLVSPAWAGVAAFVGAGLVFAGVSGWCGMARLLQLMPWNR